MENFRIENLRHETHAVMLEKLSFVAGDDPGAFLAAMLQRVEAVVGELGSIGMSKNAEYAAIMFGIVLLLHRPRRCIVADASRGRKAE